MTIGQLEVAAGMAWVLVWLALSLVFTGEVTWVTVVVAVAGGFVFAASLGFFSARRHR